MNKTLISTLFILFYVMTYEYKLCVKHSAKDLVVENSKLLLTFLVHRHGDRTPLADSVAFTTDVKAVKALSAKYGYGQLTDAGKRRAYQLGKFIRNRYNELLSPYYNKSEIYIRSTDSTRTKMSVLTAMAAVYPATEDNWSSNINWTPVPYTTVPAKYDYNLAKGNCPKYRRALYPLMTSPSEELKPYRNLLNDWSEITGHNMSAMVYLPITFYDVYLSQISLGVPVPDKVAKLLPEMEKAAAAAWNVVSGNQAILPYQSGVLLNQFFIVADQIKAGEYVPRVHVLSAHDATVFAFMAATKIASPIGVAKYGSMYALELRKTSSGQYIVLPVHLPDPSENEYNYLQMDGCDGFCDLETFRNLTSRFVLDEDTWRTKCGWTPDLVVDTSNLD